MCPQSLRLINGSQHGKSLKLEDENIDNKVVHSYTKGWNFDNWNTEIRITLKIRCNSMKYWWKHSQGTSECNTNF